MHALSPTACGRSPLPEGAFEARAKKHLSGKKFPRGKHVRLPPGGSSREAGEGERVPKGWYFKWVQILLALQSTMGI